MCTGEPSIPVSILSVSTGKPPGCVAPVLEESVAVCILGFVATLPEESVTTFPFESVMVTTLVTSPLSVNSE